MPTMARDRNGRRQYTAEFKREQIERITRGEITAAELSRELGIARSRLQRWKHLMATAGETAVQANEPVP
ncbi:MAG: transposase [Gemmatimonadetes bacterium]|nr:transposase [Gemmatimonadota bacterium]MBK7350457.1 transposase [Gemmatimonadota bacterium]MBK7716290.1 transposase [Gemmatimonadota bacterium]MBK7785602.1 transposase [Gemmatimonadota bacterium]MBK7923524.1 transposase [Gemmatimonadota bacterium]